MRKWVYTLTLVIALPAAARSTTDTIQVGNNFYLPATDTIFRGDTVVWKFPGGFIQHTTTHNVAPANRIWDSGIVPAGGTFKFAFDTVGTFPYFCTIHFLTMFGTLVVLPPPPANVNHPVAVGSFFFNPDTLHIAQGDTVTWTITDPIMPHTATHDVPPALRLFDSGILTDGQSFFYVFDTSGIFPVFCTLHPTQMSQTIFVTGGPACTDADSDGVCNADDNCPNDHNNRQENEDLDGFGDVCDPCLGDPTNTCAPACTPGDVNANGTITSADIIYLVNHVFKGGPAPLPVPAAGDVNCSTTLTSADIIYLVNHVFKGGSAPCASC
jgi:plastocyanin